MCGPTKASFIDLLWIDDVGNSRLHMKYRPLAALSSRDNVDEGRIEGHSVGPQKAIDLPVGKEP
jgi:hypothetical protein